MEVVFGQCLLRGLIILGWKVVWSCFARKIHKPTNEIGFSFQQLPTHGECLSWPVLLGLSWGFLHILLASFFGGSNITSFSLDRSNYKWSFIFPINSGNGQKIFWSHGWSIMDLFSNYPNFKRFHHPAGVLEFGCYTTSWFSSAPEIRQTKITEFAKRNRQICGTRSCCD